MQEVLKVQKKNHAFINIETEPSIHNELVDFFSFFAPNYMHQPRFKSKNWDGKIRLYNSRIRELPQGLYPYLREFCSARDYALETDISPVYGGIGGEYDADVSWIEDIPITTRGNPIEPHDYQVEAIRIALRDKSRLLLSPTASGKSLIIYLLNRYYLENHRNNILIIVDRIGLVKQMYGDFVDYSSQDSGFDAETVCHMIYTGQDKYPPKGKRIVITTWQSIYKQPIPWFEQFGMVIGDEAHGFKAQSLTAIMGKLKEAEYRIGTTGTLDNAEVSKLTLEGHFGQTLKVISTKELMQQGKVAQLDITMLALKYDQEARSAVIKMKYQDEMSYIIAHEKRNNFITNLALDQDGNTLVLYQFVAKHGKPLYKKIAEKAHRRRKVFYVSGETDVDIRENIRKITETEKNAIIVASMGTFSTGINIRNIHNVIFASPSKSQIKILQAIGRGLRVSDDGRRTHLFDIADNFSKGNRKNYTLKHAAERIKIYAKEKFDYNIYEVQL